MQKTQDGSQLTLGDKITIFNENVRVYKTPGAAADYRSKFVQITIIDQTSQSWILHNGQKINKKTMAGTYSQEAIEQAVWMHENRHWVVESVRAVAYHNAFQGDGYDTLKAIANLIGYENRDK
jgi:hypothetical protein